MASSNTCALLMVIVIAIQCSEHLVNSVITDVRLVGGPVPNKGTVELRQNNGTWETTCGTNLGIGDVIVICRQLGFPGASIAVRETPYGQSSISPIGLNCAGDKADLSECSTVPSPVCSEAGAASCHDDRYLGCFMDNRNNRVLPGDALLEDPIMNISYCIQFCEQSLAGNYTYAGVESGEECFCGEASDDYSRLGVGTDSDSNCHIQCSGDPTDSCGGTGYIAVFNINTPSPTTPVIAVVTDSAETTTSGIDSTSSPLTSSTSLISSSPNLPNSESNIGLYAGIGGSVVGVIIIILVVIFAVCLLKKRTRGQKKDNLQSHGMTVLPPSSPKGGQDNLYHNMFVDSPDETPPNLQLPDPPPEADNTYYSSVRDQLSPKGNEMYYSSVKDQESPEGGDMYYSSVKDHQAAEEDLKLVVNLDQTDGLPNKENGRAPLNGEPEAMYASAGEPRPTSNIEDFSSLYAKHDKCGNDAKGMASEDFGALYALPDKTRGVPEGQEDVKVGDLYAMPDKSRGKGRQVDQESDHNNGEGPYSLADDDIGLHVSSESPGLTVNPDDAEYGTVMVDNELYAM